MFEDVSVSAVSGALGSMAEQRRTENKEKREERLSQMRVILKGLLEICQFFMS